LQDTFDRRRLAGAPISWGVCEVPGWGRQLAPERVLAEMASLGVGATELGPVGWLPLDPDALRASLGAHELQLVGGFVPLVLHEPGSGAAVERARQMSELFAAAGAEVFVAAIVADDAWSAPPSEPLAADAWEQLLAHLDEIDTLVGTYGLRLVVHPHVGTLIERDAAVERLLADSDVGWCLDTGHLLIGGTDPAEFVRRHGARIFHVHLKDVDSGLAARVRAGELSLVRATQMGLFRPLGEGDAGIDDVLRALHDEGYERWLVLEQDTAITGEEPPAGGGPVLDVARSIEYLTTRAPEERGVARP
jgi:inosose dehydratase